ncbi:MAG: hypothetical protein EOP83_34845 [Verrucomicrobiaceae bacterium]|nr:MAG: hypothetical protein EOP83_34845 [Verrucomicrobiaceae bacterium]
MSITVLHMTRQDELQHAASRNTPEGVVRDFVKSPSLLGTPEMPVEERFALRDTRHKSAAATLYASKVYVPVARIDSFDKNLAYRLTNNIDTSWAGEPDARVTVLGNNLIVRGSDIGCASTSIGDLMRNNETGEYFLVASDGFLSLGLLDAEEMAKACA